MMRPPDQPFLRRVALERGATDQTLATWVHTGQVRRVFRGVYAPADLPDDLRLRAACAALVLPPHCVVVERSAAWLHGLDLHAPDERFVVPDLEVVSLPGHTRVRRPGIFGASRDLQDEDITHVGDVPVTTPERTVLDLLCLRGVPPALAALDTYMRHYGITRIDLERHLPRYRRRRGVVQLRTLIPLGTPLADSPGESWTRGILLQHGFAPPTLQFEVTHNGVLMAKIDMSYPHLRIAIEYFGEEFHGPDQEEHDWERIKWLRARGWYVIVVRKDDLRGAALEAWLNELRTVIADRTRVARKRTYPKGERFTH